MTQDPPKKGVSMDDFMNQPEAGMSMDEFMSATAAPETPPFPQAPPQQEAGGGASSTASATPQAPLSAPSAPATKQPALTELSKSVLPAELGGDPILSGIRETERTRVQDFTSYEQALNRLNELKEKEAKLFSAREAAKGMGGMQARLDKQLSDIGKEKAVVRTKEKELLQRVEDQAGELASNATVGDKYKALVQVTDGFEVPNPTAIHDEAKRLATQNGAGDGTAYRRIYNKLTASVEARILEPAANQKFEAALAPIMEKAKLTAEQATKFKGAAAEESMAKSQIQAALKEAEDGMSSEIKAYEESLTQAVTPIKAQHDEAAKAYELSMQQLEQALVDGTVTEQDARAAAQEAEQQYKSAYEQYSSGMDELNASTLRHMNAVKTRYNRQFEEQQARILSGLNSKFEAFNEAIGQATQDPEVRKELLAAYQKAWTDSFDERAKAQSASDKARTSGWMVNPMAAATETFFRSFTTSLGGAVKGIGTTTNSDLMYLIGDEMEKSFVTPKAQSKKLSDLLDLQNVAALSGELAGGMSPSIVAGVGTAAATQGAGAPAGVSLVVTSLMSWAAETADIAGRAKAAEFAKSGDAKKAEEVFNKSLKSQVDLMPTYALDGLPFVDKALGFIGSKPMRVMAGMGTEYTTELMQEIPQGIAEKNISEGKDPWENLFSELTEQDHSELMIGMAPVALLGGAGQVGSKSNAEAARDRVLSYIGKANVSEWVEDARSQWVSSMVSERGQPFAASVATALFADGRITEQQHGAMLRAASAADERVAVAKKAGLGPQESDVFSKLHAKADDLRARAAAEPNESLKAVMDARANELSASADAFLSPTAEGTKEGNYITVTYADGSSTLMDTAQASRAFKDPSFAARVALVGMAKDGIRIESGGSEAATLVDEFMQRVENAQSYAASVRMDPAYAQQMEVGTQSDPEGISFSEAESQMLSRSDRTADTGAGDRLTPRDVQVSKWSYRDTLNRMAKASDGERADLETPTFEQAQDMTGKVVDYEGKEGFIDIDEGGKVTFTSMDGETIVEMGTQESVSPKLATVSEVPVKNVVNPDGTVSIYDKKYVGDIAENTKRNKDGDVVSVTLQTEEGQERTFRGQAAELIAYENLLRTIDEDPVALEKLTFNITKNSDVQQLIQSEQDRHKRRITEAKRKRARGKAPRTPAPVKQDQGDEARDAQGYTAAERAELQGLMQQEELDTAEQRIKDLVAANPKHFRKGPNGEDIIRGKAPGALQRQWIDLRDTLAYKNLTQNDERTTQSVPGLLRGRNERDIPSAEGAASNTVQDQVRESGAVVEPANEVLDGAQEPQPPGPAVGRNQALRSEQDKAPVAVRKAPKDRKVQAGVSSEAEEVVENEGRPYLKHSNGVVVMQLEDGRVVTDASGYKYRRTGRNQSRRSRQRAKENARNTAIRSALIEFEEQYGIDTNRPKSNWGRSFREAEERAKKLYDKLESPTKDQEVSFVFLVKPRQVVLSQSVATDLFPDVDGRKSEERRALESAGIAVDSAPLNSGEAPPTIQALAEQLSEGKDDGAYGQYFEAISAVLNRIAADGVAKNLEVFVSQMESSIGGAENVDTSPENYPWYSAEENGGFTIEELAEQAADLGVPFDDYMSEIQSRIEEISKLSTNELDQSYEQERTDVLGLSGEGEQDANEGGSVGDSESEESDQGEDPEDWWGSLKRPDSDGPMFMAGPLRGEEQDAIGFNYTTDAIARERFDIPSLDKIGSGSDRDVYDLGDGRVLKVAKTARGLEQNMYEGQVSGTMPDVHERGLNYMVVDKVERAKFSDVVEYEGYDGGPIGKTTIGAMLKDLSRFSQLDADNHTGPYQEAMNKYGLNDMMDHDLLWNDFIALRNWGVKDGMAVHLDGGTLGGVKMINDFRKKKNLDDADFREIYRRSRAAKKQFGDKDRATMYQAVPSAPIKSKVYADRVIRSLQNLAPGVTITQHDNRGSYVKAINAYYQQQQLSPSDGAASSVAVFLPATNEIHISEVGSGNGLIHEAAHPVLTALIRANPDRFIKFYNELEAMPEAQKYIQWAEKNYADRDALVRMQEAMVEFMRAVSTGEVPVSIKADSLWQRFKNWVKELLAWAGFSPGAVDMGSPSDIKSFAAQFAEAIRFGRPMEGMDAFTPGSGAMAMLSGNPSTPAEWNAAIDVAIESAKAGKKASQAIEAAAKSLMSAMGARGASAAEQVSASDMLRAQLTSQTKRGSQAPKSSKAQKAAAESASTVSKDTVEVRIMAALKDQIRLEARAAREAKLDVSQKRAVFAKAVTGLLKNSLYGRLMPKQANALTASAARTNPDSPRSVERFFAYADRVITNANYVENLGAAKGVISKAKKLKKDSGIPNNLREVLEIISTVNASLLKDPAAFAAQASIFYNTFAKGTSDRYNMASSDQMFMYLDGIIAEQGDAYAQFIKDTYGIEVNGVDAEEMYQAIQNAEKMAKLTESLDEQKQEELRFALVQQAEGVRMDLAAMDLTPFTKEEREDVRALLSADLSHMSNADIADYIFGVDNIVVNESLDGIEPLSTTAEATVRLNRIAQMTAGSMLRSDWADNKTLRQMFFGVHNAVTAIAGFTKQVGSLSNAVGITDVSMAKTSVDNTVRKETDLLEKRIAELKEIGRKNGRDIDSAENRVWEGVIGFVIQRSEGLSAPASFDIQKRILAQDIKSNSEAYPKEYGHVIDAFNRFVSGAADANEVIERFKKERPENYEMMRFMIDMNARYRDEVLGHRLRFRNIAPSNLENYLPNTYVQSKASSKGENGKSKAEKGFSDAWEKFMATMSKPREAGSLRKREGRNLRAGMRIDYNLRLTNISKLAESLYDARVSKHWLAMYKTLTLETSDQVFGGAKNTSMLIDVAQSWYTAQSMNSVDDVGGGRAADRASKILRKLGSFYGLAGITQFITQSADQATNAAIMQGLDGTKLMGQAFSDVASMMIGKDNGLRSLISLGAIGDRAEQLSGTKWSTELESSISRLRIAIESGSIADVAKYQQKVSEFMFWSLKTSDTFSATSAWVAFYKSALKEQGITVSDWTKEAAMVMDGDIKRKDAFSYAEMMTAQTQGPSDPSMFAPWSRRGRNGWVNLMATAVNPFSSFSSSVRARLYQAGAEALRYSSEPTTDPVASDRYNSAMRVLLATAGSQAVYVSVKYALIHALVTGTAAGIRRMMTALFGEGDDEEWASRFAFWSEIAFTLKMWDRDLNRTLQLAAKDLKREAMLGPAYDREQEALQKARDNVKIGYTRWLLDMTIGGASSILDDAAVNGVNYGYYSLMTWLDAPEMKKRDGTYISFDQWSSDIENTPLGRPGQWVKEPEYGLFDLVYSRAAQVTKTFKGYGEGPTMEETMNAARSQAREERIDNSKRFNAIVWQWRQGDKEGRKEADASFDEWLRDQPVEKRKSASRAYFEAKRLPAGNPTIHLLAAESNPVVRATAMYNMMSGMSEEDRSAFMNETMRYKQIWDEPTYKHYRDLMQASKK